ncbi:MAG: hypothetical protein ACI85Q_000777 [Salibacteraceae bacterium]|jgi:hypothetical protein
MKLANTFLILMLVVLSSCEEIIEVDLQDEAPRLVIEASINWGKGTTGNDQLIKLNRSTPFFETGSITAVEGAIVSVTNDSTDDVFVFADTGEGNYTTSEFIPILNDTYTLEVIHDGETYTASEALVSVAPINEIRQSIEGGFNDEIIDLNLYFDDPVNEENFYFSKLLRDGDTFTELNTLSDRFIDGNEVFIIFEKDGDSDNDSEFLPGDVVKIELLGVSEQFYGFMEILIEQYYGGGDPFSSTAAEIRGNCINLTNEANYAYGYFRLSEADIITYTVE